MKFIQRLFSATKPPAYEASRMQSQLASVSQHFPVSPNATRRELLRVVLRDTLQRQGIPAEWIGAEALTTTSRDGKRGVHWRLLVKHWDARIVTHGVALQQALIECVIAFDPMASEWLHGISWQFDLADESVCPPLPDPVSWTARAHAQATPATQAEAKAGNPIIEEPGAESAAPAKDPDGAKEDLARLLAIRDADFREHSDGKGPDWSSTEPAKL